MGIVKTLLCLFKDDEKKEFCLRNRNTDYLFTGINKKYFDLVDSDEICIAEEVIRLNKCFKNNNFSIITIIDAKNHYNRDQKQINLFKNQYIDELKLKGYTWNEDLDEFKVEYNDTQENREILEAIENYRNLATLYQEKIIKVKKAFNDEYKKLEEDYNNKEKIFNVKIEELNLRYNSLNIECNQINDRINKGNRKIDDLLAKYNRLDNDCKYLERNKETLEKYVNDYKTVNKSLTDECESINKTISELLKNKESLNNDIQLLESRKNIIIDDINKSISSFVGKDDLNQKLDMLIEMIRCNKNYYNDKCPLYEIEHLVKLGMEKNFIINKLESNGIKI